MKDMSNKEAELFVESLARQMDEEDELANIGNSKRPMEQKELADYLNSRYGENAWKKVQKVAWCKVIEAAEPGKTYVTVTRNEDKGVWVETKNTAKEGQFLIQNAYGPNHEVDEQKDPSKWLLAGNKIAKNYKVKGEVQVGESYEPNPVPRKGIQIDSPIVLIAAWGEEMNCKAGDWLVNNGPNDTYRIDKVVFENTYEVLG